jgi:uncharacterized membrane protein/glutaredoxin
MAKASKSKKNNPKSDQRTFLRDAPNWPLLGLAVLGVILSAYLTYSAWQQQAVAGCTVGSPCDVVLNSRWSSLFGMPTSFWGLLTYLLLAAIAWSKRADLQWRWGWFVSLFGFMYSLYLTSVSLLVLDAACPYCLTSLGLMGTIFILLTCQRPENLPRFSWGPWLAKTGGVTVAAIVALHLYYAGYWGKAPKPEDPWIRALAEHLVKTEAKFYGASWCPHCNDQKELFGSSAKRLPYVECSPGGPRAPQATICKDKDIRSYPTWIINGERLTGTQTLDTLAQVSKFKFRGGQP